MAILVFSSCGEKKTALFGSNRLCFCSYKFPASEINFSEHTEDDSAKHISLQNWQDVCILFC